MRDAKFIREAALLIVAWADDRGLGRCTECHCSDCRTGEETHDCRVNRIIREAERRVGPGEGDAAKGGSDHE